MKNIHTILSEFGITVPDGQKADFDKAIATNYKTVAEFDKQAGKLTAMTERAETAEETLKGFEGKDFEAITRERDDWKQKHDDLMTKQQQEAEEREFSDLLTAAINEAKGKNPKAITALLDRDKLKASKNRDKDIKSALEAVKAENDYLFDADDGGSLPAKFTGERKGQGSGGGGNKKYSIGELMRMKNQNPDLDISKYMN